LIARSDVIVTFGLQFVEKGEDPLTRQIGDRQSSELAPALLGHRLQKQAHHGLEWVNFGGRSEFQALLTGAKRVLSLAEIGYG
jgi:hypothetical protein